MSAVDQTEGARPALQAPPLLPWNDFEIRRGDDRSEAVLLLAEIFMDDEPHNRDDVIDEVMWELKIPLTVVSKLLHYLRTHGDLRQDNYGNLRLTTRWRGWQP